MKEKIRKNPLGAFSLLVFVLGLYIAVTVAACSDFGWWGLLFVPGFVLGVAMWLKMMQFIQEAL